MAETRKKDDHGEWRMMGGVCEGYLMARRPRAEPRVFSFKEWTKMQSPEQYDAVKALWDAALARPEHKE